MLSLSTAYHIRGHRSWRSLIDDTRKLGFSALELNVQMPEEWMPDAERSVARNEITISSLHNYCPRLKQLPEDRTIYSGYLLTSDDADERNLALENTRRTIEWAGRLGAGVVVLHAGEVPTEPSGREFSLYIRQFGHQGKLFGQYYTSLMADRQKKAGHYIDLLRAALDDLLPFSVQRGVTLGLENRFHPHEIPTIEETQSLLKTFAGAPLGYWHDTGHAEVFARCGWVPSHGSFLEALAPHLCGLHLHDVRGYSDHYAPGSGEFDFGVLEPYLKGKILPLVVEAHDKAARQELQSSVSYLREHGIGHETVK
jgi:sugar phosphate isomerase/epimerase